MTTNTAEKRSDSSKPAEATGRRALAFGKYRLFARLGTGGMADVYLSVAQGAMNINRLVVIKRLRDEQANDAGAREMFLNEARLAARLSHPNVIQTFEAGNEGGSFFLAMEYVDGQPLSRVLTKMKREGKTIEPKLAARICSDALHGLHYAHELCDFDGSPLQIVHRDVSPQNVMLTYDGRIKLVDFGIAKAVGTQQTAHGVFKGKVAFMAPEQVLGDQVDRRADLFAAGIVLWETVTGKPLMAEESPAKTLYNLMNKAIPRASEANPAVPPALDEIIAKSLERDVTQRYQTGKEMRDALESFITANGGVSNDDIGELTKKLFADTREKVQAQIKAQLVTLSFRDSDPSLEASNELSLTHVRPTGPTLIDLGDGVGMESSLSNAAMFRVVTTGSAQMAAPPPSRTKRAAMVVWVGVTVLALGVSGLALFRSQRSPVAADRAPAATAAAPGAAPMGDPAKAATPDPATALTSTGAALAPATGNATPAATATAPATATTAATFARPAPPVAARPQPAAPAGPAHVSSPAEPTTKPTATQTAAPTAKPQDAPQGRTFRRDL